MVAPAVRPAGRLAGWPPRRPDSVVKPGIVPKLTRALAAKTLALLDRA